MRRRLLIALLFLVPFQLIWATAAPYCGHESSAEASKHFGHHPHKHLAGAEPAPGLDDKAGVDAQGAYHANCESCHLGCSMTVAASVIVTDTTPGRVALRWGLDSFSSHVPSGPERPDRSVPTTAVRFGGGVDSGSCLIT